MNKKAPFKVVAKILGHKDIRTTQVYAKILNETIKQEMKRIKDEL